MKGKKYDDLNTAEKTKLAIPYQGIGILLKNLNSVFDSIKSVYSEPLYMKLIGENGVL